jgi:hypothetical protein
MPPRCAEFDVDFGRKVIEGYAKITVNAEVDGPQQLVLDTSCGMAVHSVAQVADGASTDLAFSWGEQHQVRGRCWELFKDAAAGLFEMRPADPHGAAAPQALGRPLHVTLPSGLTASQKVGRPYALLQRRPAAGGLPPYAQVPAASCGPLVVT